MHKQVSEMKKSCSIEWIVGVIVLTSLGYLQVCDCETGYIQIGYPLVAFLTYDRIQIDTGFIFVHAVCDIGFAVILTVSAVSFTRMANWPLRRFSVLLLFAAMSATGTFLWICDQQLYSWLFLPAVVTQGVVVLSLVAPWYCLLRLVGLGLTHLGNRLHSPGRSSPPRHE